MSGTITRWLARIGVFVVSTAAVSAAEFALPKPLALAGLHAYAEKSLCAGETIHFRVSSTVPYQLSICRLGCRIDDPAGDVILSAFPESPPVEQPIHPGSYIHVENSLSAGEPLRSLTLECWVRPWRVNAWQTLLCQYDYPTACGFGLFVDPEGRLLFYLGDADRYRPERSHGDKSLEPRRWQHVVGTWDGKTKSLWIDGELVGQWPFDGPVRPGSAPLRIGGCGYDGPVVNLLDGDIAMPALYGRALLAAEIADRFAEKGLSPAAGEQVLGCWSLAEERGRRTADVSGCGRDGRIVNEATWMIGGPSFDAAAVPRYGSYDPAADIARGHGLRLASDDLYDCRWQVTHTYRIPETARPGIYVGRFRFTIDGVPRLYHVAFLVKKAADRPKAPLLVLASTGSWLAYSATSFAVTPPGTHYHWGTTGITNSPGNPPAYCMYRNHHAGQPAFKVGVNKPWPNAGPYVLYAQGGSGYSHLMRSERYALVWLEGGGYAYDMVGDHELDRDPDLLRGYRAVLVNGHGEYWSARSLDGLERYLGEGGNLIVLSGNVMLWRVSFDQDGTVMECRKFDPRLGGRENAAYGEMWHSHDGGKGSLLRECGYPEFRRIGLAPFGWWGIGPDNFGLYRVARSDHFLFHEPEPVGLAAGETFGGRAGAALPKAVGHEYDALLSVVAKHTPTVPAGAELPKQPAEIVNLADGILPGATGMDYFFRERRPAAEGVVCNMIYWERAEGGRVFNAGSIGAGWGLSEDPKFQALLRNVLHHFGVSPEGRDEGSP